MEIHELHNYNYLKLQYQPITHYVAYKIIEYK